MFFAVYTVYGFVVSKFADLLTESANYSWCHSGVITNILHTRRRPGIDPTGALFSMQISPSISLPDLQNNHECSLCKQKDNE